MKFIFFVGKFCVFIFISFVVIISALYINAFLSPTIDLKNSGKLYIYDNNDDLIYQGSTSSSWIELESISQYIIDAVVSVEDKNFFEHIGFDYTRIASAAIKNISNNYITQGASTITQQYAKNMYLSFEQTWQRKIEEAFLTLELEVHYSKEAILEGYLNTIYYGNGCYGIENASQFYFNKSSSDVTFEEALILAGIPKSPNAYNPLSDYDSSIQRANTVAYTMLNNDLITKDVYDNLFMEDIDIHGSKTENNLQMLMYYQDAVLEELYSLSEIPSSLIESGGLKIYTTLDMEAQKTLETNILEYSTDDDVQVASVLVDPNTGGVIALTGGIDYSTSTYNRALYSQRQVASTMKTFLYYAALENNLTSSSTFTSEPTTFNLANNLIYSPSNYGDNYANKNITMAAAIAFSDNIYAVKTNLFLGVDALINTAKLTGITSYLDPVASLALGTSEINIMDLATGYTTFASGGFKHDLYFISKIEDMNGNVLYEKSISKDLVLNYNYVYILNEMLTSTYDYSFVDYTNATAASISSKLTNTYSFKSGTTDTDSWSIGYNPDLLMLLWMGYDDNDNINTSISSASKNIWADTVETVLSDVESSWYIKPDNVVALILNSVTGEVTTNESNASLFYYVKGSEPLNSYYNFNTP